jgi:hypothetical protein
VSAARLGRRYRRLLWAYPPGRRRDEVLDTLMEAAPAGRTRPSMRETLNLLRYGLRARLGRPAKPSVVVLAVLVALFTGCAGAGVASRLAWNAVPDYPSGTALAEITGTVYPGVPTEGQRTGDGLFEDVMEPSTVQVLLQGHDEDFGFAQYEFGPGFMKGDYREWTNATAARMEAAGWEVHDLGPTGATWIATGELDESGRSFWAKRDGLAIDVSSETDVVDTPAGSFFSTATMARFTPWWVTALGGVGWLLGFLVGWLLTGWASRRTEEATGAVRSLTREPAVVALLLVTPQAVLATVAFLLEPFQTTTPVAPFWSLSVTWGYSCNLLAVALFVLSLFVAAFGGRTGPDPLVDREEAAR